MKDIKELRKEIDVIDNEMKKLFLKRMDVVSDVMAYKMKNNIGVYDPKREENMIENLTKDIDESMQEYYLAFLKNYIDLSKHYQNSKKNK